MAPDPTRRFLTESSRFCAADFVTCSADGVQKMKPVGDQHHCAASPPQLVGRTLGRIHATQRAPSSRRLPKERGSALAAFLIFPATLLTSSRPPPCSLVHDISRSGPKLALFSATFDFLRTLIVLQKNISRSLGCPVEFEVKGSPNDGSILLL